ncbi:hypothetical protein D3C76_687130 [compost metagenome]
MKSIWHHGFLSPAAFSPRRMREQRDCPCLAAVLTGQISAVFKNFFQLFANAYFHFLSRDARLNRLEALLGVRLSEIEELFHLLLVALSNIYLPASF